MRRQKITDYFLSLFVVVFMVSIMALTTSSSAQDSKPEDAQTKSAVFAGGCFWSIAHAFEEIDGVVSAAAGYSGGTVANPTYEKVLAGGTGHKESVRVVYDPAKVSFESLLAFFWRNIDPFDPNGQLCDHGDQYHTAIFVGSDKEREAAEDSKKEIEKQFGKNVATQILPAAPFFPAEEYHQEYARKNPVRYKMYRTGCGRDYKLKDIWGKDAGGAVFVRHKAGG